MNLQPSLMPGGAGDCVTLSASMKRPCSETVIRKLVLAKYFYALAEDNIRPEDPMTAYAGVHLLQDSVEAHLLALAEAVSANIEPNTKFERYFELIEEKLPVGAKIPGKVRLFALNKLRVNAKHYAIQPDLNEAVTYLTTVRDFFEETTSSLLGQSWASVTLIDLIRDGETRTCLVAAQGFYDAGRYSDCLIECRKALFLEFESGFNILGAIPSDSGTTTLWAMVCRAPRFARTRSYVDSHVKDPTDYIVYDYDQLHRDLDEAGIRIHDFWNVWRLTPEVFRRAQGSWAVKRDFCKLFYESAAQNAEYVLHTAVRIILAKQRALKSIRTSPGGAYRVVLKHEETNVYAKSDASSEVIWTTPKGLWRVSSRFLVDGLDQGSQRFYEVSRVPPEGRCGYILESAIDRLEDGSLTDEEIELIWGRSDQPASAETGFSGDK